MLKTSLHCIAWLCCFLALPADAIQAHPGHGVGDPHSASHYLLEPLHTLPFILVALAFAVVLNGARRARQAASREKRKLND